jgi:hypothetical protein
MHIHDYWMTLYDVTKSLLQTWPASQPCQRKCCNQIPIENFENFENFADLGNRSTANTS